MNVGDYQTSAVGSQDPRSLWAACGSSAGSRPAVLFHANSFVR